VIGKRSSGVALTAYANNLDRPQADIKALVDKDSGAVRFLEKRAMPDEGEDWARD